MEFKVKGRRLDAYCKVSAWVILRLGRCSRRAMLVFMTLQTLPYSDSEEGWRGSPRALRRAVKERFGSTLFGYDYRKAIEELTAEGLVTVRDTKGKGKRFRISLKQTSNVPKPYERETGRNTPAENGGKVPRGRRFGDAESTDPGRNTPAPRGESPRDPGAKYPPSREPKEKREPVTCNQGSLSCPRDSSNAANAPGGGAASRAPQPGNLTRAVVGGYIPPTALEQQETIDRLQAQKAQLLAQQGDED